MQALTRARFAVVMPAFRVVGADTDALSIVQGGKPALESAVAEKAATQFATTCKACHGATDFSRWLALPPDASPYAINTTDGYEYRCCFLTGALVYDLLYL